jgi:hypothetical protein
MSKLDDLQKQYQGYVAASEAVKKTDPGEVEVVYKNDSVRTYDGFFVYSSEKDNIKIVPQRYCENSDYVYIDADDLPALVKALREFIE